MRANQFDLIVSHFAFSEFPNGVGVIREMERLLKPGGMILIQDILRPPLWQMSLLMAWRFVTRPFGRICRQYRDSLRGAYTAKELRAMFGRTSLVFSVKSFLRWGGGIGRVWALKPSHVQPEVVIEEREEKVRP